MDDNIINYNSGNMVIKDSKDTTIWSTNTKNKGVSPILYIYKMMGN